MRDFVEFEVAGAKVAHNLHTVGVAPLRDQYTAQDFKSAVPMESDDFEFKTGVSSAKIQEAFVGFSNATGGTIFVGIANDGTVKGRRLDQGTAEQIHQAAGAARDVGRYSLREITVGGQPVTAIEVKPRQEGFAQTSEGRTLVRRGPSNVALFGYELQDFINRRALRRFESVDSGLALAESIDPRLRAELAEAIGITATEDADFGDRLRERGLAVGDDLTVAGALFLSEPERSLSLSKAVVEVRRFRDDGPDYDRRVVFNGPLHRQVRDVTTFITDELGSDLIVTGLYRYDMPRLPEVVVREAIANAVAHRSYEVDRTAVLVEIRPDRLVIRSPGGLPEPVTIETIRSAQAARNPIIIDVLRKFALAEDAGRGVDVIEDKMQDALLDPPRFSEDGPFVTVILPLSGPITSQERAWITELERSGSLAPADRLLVVHAARGEILTNRAAREILNTEDSGTARKSLHRLRDAGILSQRGDRGSSRYRLTEKVAPPAAYRMSRVELADLALAAARDQPLTNEVVRQLTGLGRPEALALLRQLVSNSLLVKLGEKRGTTYVLPDQVT